MNKRLFVLMVLAITLIIAIVLMGAAIANAAPPLRWRTVNSMTPTPTRTYTPTLTPSAQNWQQPIATATTDCWLLICTGNPLAGQVCPPPPPIDLNLACKAYTPTATP